VAVVGHVGDREEAVGGGQGLAAVANLTFMKGFQSQRDVEAVEAVEAVEGKAVEGIEVKAVPVLALQQERA
jgi:hypothetical protein